MVTNISLTMTLPQLEIQLSHLWFSYSKLFLQIPFLLAHSLVAMLHGRQQKPFVTLTKKDLETKHVAKNESTVVSLLGLVIICMLDISTIMMADIISIKLR